MKQCFGFRGELQNTNRQSPDGSRAELVWNLKDEVGAYASNGLYIWKVLYTYDNGFSRTKVYRNGLIKPSNSAIDACVQFNKGL